MNVKANDVLNGFVAGYSQVTNGIASLKALDGVDNDANITSVEGEPVEPRVLTLGQVNDSFYSDLITITEATLASTSVEGVKGVFASNDSVNVRVYNSFGLGSKDLKMPKSYAGKKFDLTGILVNTVATNGTVLYEIGLLTSPTESVVNSIQQMNTASLAADIYTLDGRRVENMSKPGIYIVRQGQNIRKVFVK